MPQRDGPIALFDSGIGGTTVLREVARLLPGESLLYLADQARCPYGPRSERTLQHYSRDNTEWLLERGAKMVVVACNTASAAALQWLRARYPRLPFVGMVPAVKPAALATRSGVVGVLATPTTMQGKLLRDVIDRWAAGVQVVTRVAPGLVEAIEAGEMASDTSRAIVQEALAPMLAAGADTLVLGCTHYPYLIPLIRDLAPSLDVVDAAPAVARQVARRLAALDLQREGPAGEIHYVTTGLLSPFRTRLAALEVPPGSVGRAEGHPALVETELSAR